MFSLSDPFSVAKVVLGVKAWPRARPTDQLHVRVAGLHKERLGSFKVAAGNRLLAFCNPGLCLLHLARWRRAWGSVRGEQRVITKTRVTTQAGEEARMERPMRLVHAPQRERCKAVSRSSDWALRRLTSSMSKNSHFGGAKSRTSCSLAERTTA